MRRPSLSYANVMASLGVFIALGGSSYAALGPPGGGSSASTYSPPTGPAGGDLTGEYPNPLIREQAVTGRKLAPGAVTTPILGDNAVTAPKIANDAVGASEIRAGSVFSTEITDGTVLAQDLATNSVASSEIATGAVQNAEIADNAVTSAKIPSEGIFSGDLGTNSVGSRAIGTSAVGGPELADGGVGTSDIATRPAARVWRNTNQLMNGGSDTNVAFNSEIYDTANLFDPAVPGQLRAPVAGLYYVQGTALVAGDSPWNVGLATGTTYVANTTVDGPFGGAFYGNVSTLLRMNAGGTVNLRLFNGSSTAREVVSKYQASPTLSMHWLGPL